MAKQNFLELGCIIEIFTLLSRIALNLGKHIDGNGSIRNGVFSTMSNSTDGLCCAPEVVGNFKNWSVLKISSFAMGQQGTLLDDANRLS